MKKLGLLFFILIASNTFAQTLEVPLQKKALLFKATASWCTPCGFYHYVTDEIYNQHSDSILFLNGHVATSEVGDMYSGDMHNLLNGGGGIPSYSLSGVHLADWPPTVEMILNEASNFFASDIVANVAFQYEIAGDELTINTTTKFFQDATADKFYVGAMVVENNILVNQQMEGGVEEMIQHRIQRTVLGELNDMGEGKKLWADEIASGTVAGGSVINHSFSQTLNSEWNDDELEILVVIWQRVDDTFIALSAEDVECASGTGISNRALTSAVTVYPNPVTERLNINLNNMKNSTLTISDQVGRVVYTAVPVNNNCIVDVSHFNKGYYFVTILDDTHRMITRGVIVN